MKRQIYFRKRHRYLSCYYIADESLLIFLYAVESPRAIAPHISLYVPYRCVIMVSPHCPLLVATDSRLPLLTR